MEAIDKMPDKKAWSFDKALFEIRFKDRIDFDPLLVTLFTTLLKRHTCHRFHRRKGDCRT